MEVKHPFNKKIGRMKKIKKIKKLKKGGETFSQSVKKPAHSLAQKPRIHSKERRLSNRNLTKLKI